MPRLNTCYVHNVAFMQLTYLFSPKPRYFHRTNQVILVPKPNQPATVFTTSPHEDESLVHWLLFTFLFWESLAIGSQNKGRIGQSQGKQKTDRENRTDVEKLYLNKESALWVKIQVKMNEKEKKRG